MKMIFFSLLLFSPFLFGQEIPPSPSPLFQTTKTVNATLTADFTKLWSKRHLVPPPGNQTDLNPEAFVQGTLTYTDDSGKESAPLPVELRVRGNSSRDDCEFPKLRLEFGDTELKDTIFDGASSVKIGTHCADIEGNSGRYQRLRNQKEPHREVALYQIVEALGVPSFKARTAIMTYVDTGNNNSSIKRAAFFLESPNEFKKRFQAEEIFIKGSAEAKASEADAAAKAAKNHTQAPTPVYFSDASATVDPAANENEIVKAMFAESLLANVDWDLIIKGDTNFGYPMWNLKAYLLPDGTKIIVPYDFDLARLATNPNTTEMQSNISLYLRRAKNGFGGSLYQKTADFYKSEKDTVEKIIDAIDLVYPNISNGEMIDDSNVKQQMKDLLRYFWNSIGS